MRRLLSAWLASAALAAVVLPALLLAPTAARAGHSPGQGPPHDFAQGTGKFASGTLKAQFHVNAQSGPAGQNPRGHVFVRRASGGVVNLNFSGRVTCLTVTGNRAVVGAVVERTKTPLVAVGNGVLLEFVDNGKGANAPPDASDGFLIPAAPAACPAVLGIAAPFRQGNFVVHDAAVAPQRGAGRGGARAPTRGPRR
jgi:hypothetical protein